MDTFTSIFDEPSKGSIATTYLALSLPVWIISSSSSDKIPTTSPPFTKALIKRILAIMSNFCWASPCTLSCPNPPVMSINPARLISRLMILDAKAMSRKSWESSPVAYGKASCCLMMKRSSVVPTGKPSESCVVIISLLEIRFSMFDFWVRAAFWCIVRVFFKSLTTIKFPKN